MLNTMLFLIHHFKQFSKQSLEKFTIENQISSIAKIILFYIYFNLFFDSILEIKMKLPILKIKKLKDFQFIYSSKK